MSVWATNETFDKTKANQKSLLVGTGLKLTNLTTTAEGQLVFSKTASGVFLADKLYARLTGNSTWSGNLTESAEQSSASTETISAALLATDHRFTFFTLPSTEKFYIITGVEWKNGSSIGGGAMINSGVVVVDANPPVVEHLPILAMGAQIAQSGINTVQRCSQISSKLARAGTVIGVYFSSNINTNFFRNNESQTNNRISSFGHPKDACIDDPLTDGVSYYTKVYFRGYK